MNDLCHETVEPDLAEGFESWSAEFNPNGFTPPDIAKKLGIDDFGNLLKSVSESSNGMLHLSQVPNTSSVFAKCELFFVQVEKMGQSTEEFAASFPGISKQFQSWGMDHFCPESKGIRDELAALNISPESKARLFELNPDFETAWHFYGET